MRKLVIHFFLRAAEGGEANSLIFLLPVVSGAELQYYYHRLLRRTLHRPVSYSPLQVSQRLRHCEAAKVYYIK